MRERRNEMRVLREGRGWGEQGGLLSIDEMTLLDSLASEDGPPAVLDASKLGEPILEVGHYYGLSTIVLACSGRPVVTVDNHRGDVWVPEPAGIERFLKNVERYSNLFGYGPISPLFMDSQNLIAPLRYAMVFYDGDHGLEQMRFTREVHKSPRVELFVFDDRDFPVPAQCSEYLRAHGWRDESPPVHRGPRDKASEETMTLGVFRR